MEEIDAKNGNGAGSLSMAKPVASGLERFKSKRAPDIANVGTLVSVLAVHKIARAKDYVRLHPDDEYWSDELCFVNIPILGQSEATVHLIDEDVAMLHLDAEEIDRYRLALATKPHDVFFLCVVPSQNLDNTWNRENLSACETAKDRWVRATSRRSEGAEGYKVKFAQDEDAFPAPSWPNQSFEELLMATFDGRMIVEHEHPGLKRLLGAKQSAR